jgi:hypothetical protein
VRKTRSGGRRVRRACGGGWCVWRRARACTSSPGRPHPVWHAYPSIPPQCNDAQAALSEPTLLGKASGFWDFLGAHASGRFRPGLLMGTITSFLGKAQFPALGVGTRA